MAACGFGRWLVGGAIWCAMSVPATAATVTLAWDPNPEPDVNNYNVFVRTAGGSFGQPIPVGNRTNWTFVGLLGNVQYYFAVQAQSPAGLSPLSQVTYVIPTPNAPGSEASRSDFNGDGRFDLLWQNSTTGQLSAWHMNGSTVLSYRVLTPSQVPPGWNLSGSADFSGDGKPDLVWHNPQTGDVSIWLMDGVMSYYTGAYVWGGVPSAWRITSVRDFNADGNPDIWWQNQTTGDMSVWYFNGTTMTHWTAPNPPRVADTNWKMRGSADFNRDGQPDALWHNEVTGEVSVWLLNGVNYVGGGYLTPKVVPANWKIVAVGDTNFDGWPDIVWRNDLTGELSLWAMQGTNAIWYGYLSIPSVDVSWKIVGPR
jgi:hypothetical protein